MGLFDKVFSQHAGNKEQAKLHKEIEQAQETLKKNPNNVEALRQLSLLYESANMVDDAIQCFVRLSQAFQQSKQSQLAIAYYRKAEKLANKETKASILRDIARLHQSLGQYEEAYVTCRQVIEIYLAINQKEAATGFVNSIPALGEKDEIYRKELREMIGEKDEKWAQGAKGSWVDEQTPKPSHLISSNAKVAVTPKSEKELFATMNVLVVDDDLNICKIFSAVLRSLGCQVITANDGQEGLEKAKQLRPNLIVSDLLMPKLDGSQLFTKLQEDPLTQSIPFVCLTSRAQEEEKLAAFHKGVEDYWVKPFVVSEISMRIKKLLLRQLKTQTVESVAPKVEPGELTGNIADIQMPQLLRMLEYMTKTGILSLTNNTAQGSIIIQKGRIHDAHSGGQTGEDALLNLLTWTEGNFSFRSQAILSERTIEASLDEIFDKITHHYQRRELLSQLPALDTYLIPAAAFDKEILEQSFPNFVDKIITLLDGQRTLGECVTALGEDLEGLQYLVYFYRQGLVVAR